MREYKKHYPEKDLKSTHYHQTDKTCNTVFESEILGGRQYLSIGKNIAHPLVNKRVPHSTVGITIGFFWIQHGYIKMRKRQKKILCFKQRTVIIKFTKVRYHRTNVAIENPVCVSRSELFLRSFRTSSTFFFCPLRFDRERDAFCVSVNIEYF